MGGLKKGESLEWKIANTDVQCGRFDQIDRYLPPLNDIAAAEIKVPEKLEKESTLTHTVAGFIVPTTRAFEIWWDSEESDMKIVLVTKKNDLTLYTNAYKNMYPRSSITELKRTEPKWFNPNKPYDYFDISTINGNHVTTFEIETAEYFITQVISAMKLAKYGWLQVVFKEYSGFTNILREYSENLRTYAEKRKDKTDDISLYLKQLLDYSRGKQNVVNSVMSIRGLVEFRDGLDMLKQIPCNMIQTPGIERLQLYRYNPHRFFSHHQPTFMKDGMQRYTIYPRRMVPDPAQYLLDIKNYLKPKSGGFFGQTKYLPRKPLPFLIITPDEMPIFLHLPDPSRTGGVIKTISKQLIPPSPTNKRGYNIGFFERYNWESSDDYRAMFGKQVVSKDVNAVTLTFPTDFTTHGFVVGGTGSGKSSMMRAIFKHLEMSNIYASYPQDIPVKEIIETGLSNEMDILKDTDFNKTLGEQHIGEESAIIYIDPKGDDSELFVKQTEKISRDKHMIHYLDPEITPFSINPLELPSNIPSANRELVVAKYTGLLAVVLDKLFGGSKQFVFLNRVIKLVITYLYSYSDTPTFLDMYDVVNELANNDTNAVEVLTGMFGKPDEEMEKSLNQLKQKKAEAFDSFFNRLEQIRVTQIFREMFCREKSTIRMDDIIQPGHYTVFRLSKTNIPEDLVNLVMQTIISQIWFSVLQRSAKDPNNSKGCQIILVVDEFWMIKEFEMLKEILAQGRSKGIGLFLATQTITQVTNASDLGEMLANTHIKLIGKITGGEAKQLAVMIDPDDPSLITQLVNHSKHQWTAQIPPPPGEDRLRPMECTNHFNVIANDVVELQMNDDEFIRFIESERKRYKPITDEEQDGTKDEGYGNKNKWMGQMSKALPSHIYWSVLLYLDKQNNKPATLQEIANHLALQAHWKHGKSDRNYVKQVLLKEMVEEKHLHYVNSRTNEIYDLNIYNGIDKKLPNNTSFCMTISTRDKYFTYSEEKVGKDGTADIPEGIKQLTSFYKDKGMFVTVAEQKVKRGEFRTDFVAYNYDKGKAISVELESLGEASSNQQQVIKNLMKWKMLGFDQCHIWSFDANIVNLVKQVQESATELTDEDKKNIFPFVMKHDDYTLAKLRSKSKTVIK